MAHEADVTGGTVGSNTGTAMSIPKNDDQVVNPGEDDDVGASDSDAVLQVGWRTAGMQEWRCSGRCITLHTDDRHAHPPTHLLTHTIYRCATNSLSCHLIARVPWC